MTWKIVTDSGATLRSIEDLNTEIEYEVVPLSIITDSEEIVDHSDIDLDEFIEKINATAASSSACPSPEMYRKAYESGDKIICFTITGALSGSFNSAQIGAQQLIEDHPEKQIFVFDTKSAGPEIDMLVKKTIELIEHGKDFDEVVTGVQDYHKNTHLLFLLESIENLVKNGRVNRVIGSLVGLLNLRLVGERSLDGKIELANRARGTKKGLKMILDEMVENGYVGGRVEIAHMHNRSLAEEMAERIRARYGDIEVGIRQGTALCYFYAEKNGLMIGYER